jgi:acetyl-CoA carboxylase carboxyl transferase subunit beta
MSWLEKLLPPKSSNPPTRQAQCAEGVWIKCPSCEAVLYKADLEANQNVCPSCSHHLRIGARARLDTFLDAGALRNRARSVAVALKFKQPV